MPVPANRQSANGHPLLLRQAAHFQNTRRSCRSSYLCSLYGGVPAALREIRRQDPAGSVHERKLHSLHPFLFMYFHPSISCAEPFGMCALRILRWNYVAGTFSTASVSIPRGGTTMFALLALAGDLGCSGGPTLAGLVSSYAGGSLKSGIFAAITFPAVLLLGLIKSKNLNKK